MTRARIASQLFALSCVCFCASLRADESTMRNVFPQDLQWRQANGYSSGTEVAIVHGSADTAGILVYRLRLAAGAKLDPHQHPDERWFTVLSGTFAIGLGESPVWSNAQEQKERSFFAIPANTLYYGVAKTDVILQIQTAGPTTTP